MKTVRLVIMSLLMSIASPLTARQNDGVSHVRYDIRDGLSSENVGGGVQDRNGLLWFATWNGLNCYDGYDFHRVYIRPGDKVSISTNRIRDILLSDDGNILCHTDDDIYEFDLHSYSFSDIPPEMKDSIGGRMGKRWRGFYDSQGNFWSSEHSGLDKDLSRHHPARVLPETSGREARALLLDSDSVLWVATRSDWCVRRYGSDGRLLDVASLDFSPYCMFQTRDGDVWMSGKPGALVKNGIQRITDDAIYDMAEDRWGRLWMATFGGGVKCCENPQAEHPVLSPSIGGYKIRKLLITPSDNIIAATTDGLLVGHIDGSDCRNTILRRIVRDGNNPGSLSSNATMSVARDSRGNVFVATESSGLDMIEEKMLFSDNPEFIHINTGNSGMPSDIINAMRLDSDSLLMIVGCDHVMTYNPLNGHFQNLSSAFWTDSCLFMETTPLKLHDGSWVFGAEQGAFRATEHNIYSRGYVPPIVFTTVVINGETEDFTPSPGGKTDLPRGQRNVTVRFAALDYVDNKDILYRTRMDGSPWTKADRSRSVTFFNMTPGLHTLEVQSTDRYGRWVDNTATQYIDVPPYWYETWWAYLLFAVVALGFLTGIVYTFFYIRNVNRNRRELLEKYMALLKENSGAAADGRGREEQEMQPLNAGQKPEDTLFLKRVRRYIEENIGNPDANVDDMAMAAAASRSTLNRHLRAQLGITGAQLLIEARMQRAQQLLLADNGAVRSMSEIADLCGYTDVHYFMRVFKKKFGVNPTEYKMTGNKV